MDDHEDASKQGGKIAELDADEYVILEDVAAKLEKDDEVKKNADVQGRQEESQAQAYHIDLEQFDKVLSMHDDEPELGELKEVIEVVTTAKLMTEVVTIAATTAASTITAAPSAARRRKEGKQDNVVLRYQVLKRKQQTEAQAKKNMIVYLKNMAGFKMDYFKGMSYDAIRLIFEKYFNSNVAFLEKTKEQLEEEESRALKRKTKSSKEKAVKKQKLDEEVEELKKYLQIMPNDDDDVYTEATPLALKVPVVDYEIYSENNKPYYKIIRADRSHQLFLSFLSLLRNFNREDLEVLWQIVKERFASSKPKKFSDYFLLTTLTYMLKLKFGRIKEAFMMILLVERRYPLTRFTFEQMLNNVWLEVKEESEVSLELLRFVRRQQQEGYNQSSVWIHPPQRSSWLKKKKLDV
nr:hypothetical protein [Tanacetum cinerariifolium]